MLQNRLFTILNNGTYPINGASFAFKVYDNEVSPEYKLFKEVVHKVNACYLGTAACARLLRQLPYEDKEDYIARQKDVVINNFVKRSITKIVGRIMRKGVEVNPRYDIIHKIHDLAEEVATEYLREGAVGVLLDRPTNGGDIYQVVYTRAQILDWTYDEQDNLTYVKIVTPVRVGDIYEAEYREIRDDGTHTVWFTNGEKRTIQTSFTEIPFVFFNSHKEPLFADVAQVQLNHMNQRSLLDSYQQKVGAPYLFTKGLGLNENNTLKLSINSTINTDNTEADVRWVETNGSSIPNLAQDLKDKALYAETLALQAGETLSKANKTATQVGAETAEQDALLTHIAEATEKVLRRVMLILDPNADDEAIQINKDFRDDSGQVTSIIGQLNGAVTSGNLSRETFIKALVKADVIELDSLEEELKRIDDEQSTLDAQLGEPV